MPKTPVSQDVKDVARQAATAASAALGRARPAGAGRARGTATAPASVPVLTELAPTGGEGPGSTVHADVALSGIASAAAPADGRVRAVIDAVEPQVDGGRFAAKCIAGEPTDLVAHCFADGHDRLRVVLAWRALGQATRDAGAAQDGAREIEMRPGVNDEWHGAVTFPAPGRYAFTVTAWVDALASWRHDFERRIDIADLRVAAQVAAKLLEQAAGRAAAAGAPDDAAALRTAASRLGEAAPGLEPDSLRALALDESVLERAARHPDRSLAVAYPERVLVADRPRARFSTWYELFPRSACAEPGRHGTFADVEQRLPYVASMGFDVLYLPPIHPIGRERRKGRNNTLEAGEGDVGSPWAIGAAEGGHTEIHPALGTLADFGRLAAAARKHGIDVALDVAFQCAPDHPWVQAHPQWFRHRPDGSIQYAENPPKKYQDIYPFDFETEDWRALWLALRGIFDHWIAQGVTIFRVDNPHTKAFAFWEWCIADIKARHPEAIFLAEAFTRPKVMHRLAKLGFTQSYTYFTWRHSKHELAEYMTELAHTAAYHYFRPNFWPNTPDILDRAVQGASWPMFAQRLVLAATLCSSYGIYGPAWELMDNRALREGGEEYLDSEKYQLRHWDLERPDSLRHLIARVNAIRREHPALQDNRSLCFMPIDNEQLLAYSKRSRDGRDTVLVVVNLDAASAQAGWIDVNLDALGLAPDTDYVVHDLLDLRRFTWRNGRNYVLLDPHHSPAHVFVVEPGPRTETQFDGY
jgi:starch synthase (maltosyl-transferring)